MSAGGESLLAAECGGCGEPLERGTCTTEGCGCPSPPSAESAEIILRRAQDRAHAILSTTIATEKGRTFPTRSAFAECLAFLAALSGDDQWAFLLIGDDRG